MTFDIFETNLVDAHFCQAALRLLLGLTLFFQDVPQIILQLAQLRVELADARAIVLLAFEPLQIFILVAFNLTLEIFQIEFLVLDLTFQVNLHAVYFGRDHALAVLFGLAADLINALLQLINFTRLSLICALLFGLIRAQRVLYLVHFCA